MFPNARDVKFSRIFLGKIWFPGNGLRERRPLVDGGGGSVVVVAEVVGGCVVELADWIVSRIFEVGSFGICCAWLANSCGFIR